MDKKKDKENKQVEPEINDRTIHEIDYLKHHVGPILIAALSEICTHRPSDPIEYLGYWLVRFRYNEELKRRDILNTMEAIQLKWTLGEDPNTLLEGFTPSHPFPPPGYGGPLNPNDFVEESGEEGPREPRAEYLGEMDYFENVPEDEWEELEEPPTPQPEPSYVEEFPQQDEFEQELDPQLAVGAAPTPSTEQHHQPTDHLQPPAKAHV